MFCGLLQASPPYETLTHWDACPQRLASVGLLMDPICKSCVLKVKLAACINCQLGKRVSVTYARKIATAQTCPWEKQDRSLPLGAPADRAPNCLRGRRGTIRRSGRKVLQESARSCSPSCPYARLASLDHIV